MLSFFVNTVAVFFLYSVLANLLTEGGTNEICFVGRIKKEKCGMKKQITKYKIPKYIGVNRRERYIRVGCDCRHRQAGSVECESVYLVFELLVV